MKKILPLTSIIFMIYSCTIQGLTNDYGKLKEDQKTKILTLKNFDETKPGNVYKINASQLKEELKKYPKSIVYIFTSGCHSKYCKPLITYEQYSISNGYKLFLVMTGYMDFDKAVDQEISNPIYVIDNKYYKKVIRSTYVKYFENDLLNKDLSAKNEFSGSIYFFNNGVLEKITRELPDTLLITN